MPVSRSIVPLFAVLGLAFALLTPTPARAQSETCAASWLSTFGGAPGVDNQVRACVVFDDGGGPALYAAGRFLTAGGVPAGNVARWDGTHWEPLGIGMNNSVNALAVFDDGSGAGPQLYAGGEFWLADGAPVYGLAKWDGNTWSAVGNAVIGVYSLLVFDDGSGSALYVGGLFEDVGGTPASSIARWDGAQWSALGSGMGAAPGGYNSVRALATFDDGGGPALYAGGEFVTAGGRAVNHVAKWDGTVWSALGAGVSGEAGSYDIDAVYALAVHDDGSGPKLYVGGGFLQAGGLPASYVASWDGTVWSALGSGTSRFVYGLQTFDDGGGPALYVGGEFDVAGGSPASGIARWDGSTWSALGDGVQGIVDTLVRFDDGSGPSLFVGGTFLDASGTGALNIARWSGTGWASLLHGVNGAVQALLAYEDGNGKALVAGGTFRTAGGVPLNCIGRWDGSAWQALGSGMLGDPGSTTYVDALAVFDSGTGPDLIACGHFETAGGVPALNIARWDGASWSELGGGLGGYPRELAVWDDGNGPALFVGGYFGQSIKRWDGSSWSLLASGVNDGITALGVFDDGSGGGPALFAGGLFTKAGGVLCNHIAKWDGTSWSPLGAGCDDVIYGMAVFDDGGGPALYVAGSFEMAGGVPANHVAKWTGSQWSALGGGVDGNAEVLAVFDDGSGPALFVGGVFEAAGGVPVTRIAKWDGSTWAAVGSGVTSMLGTGSADFVSALATFDDGSGESLFMGGYFTSVPDSGDSYLARWGGCPVPPSAWSNLGYALPGAAGPPLLQGSGSLVGGQPAALDLTHAAPSAPAGLFLSVASAPQAFKGGTLLPVPALLALPLVTSPAGTIHLTLAWPTGLPPALAVWYQYAIKDPAAAKGVALSNGMNSVTP